MMLDYTTNATTVKWHNEWETATSTTTSYWTYETTSTTTLNTSGYTNFDDGLCYKYANFDTSLRYKYIYHPPSPKDKLKEMLKSRMYPKIITNSRRNPIISTNDDREKRARETLRRVLGDQKFKNFLKTGFVSVKAKSGLIYQIFPGHDISCVFKDGQMTDRLCVVLSGNFPPTDSLIMRYLMILNNEQQFQSLAIKHGVYNTNKTKIKNQDHKSLLEIYKEIKAA